MDTTIAAERAEADGRPRTSDAELDRVRQQLADEQERRASAEHERDAERQRVAAERSNRFAAQEAAVASALDSARTRLAVTKRAYAEAVGQGRFQESAELQEQIAEAALEIRGLSWQQQQFDQARRQPPGSEPRSGFEEVIAALPQAAQDWCRRHPAFITDRHQNARAQAAHFSALSEGLPEWSREYWDFVETRLGLKEPGDDDEVDLANERAANAPGRASLHQELQDARRHNRAGATTAAPPSRGTTTGTGEPRRRTRQPTAGELEAAKISFPDEWKENPRKALELYFENQAALRREGRLK
jgi:hypothetical protein